MPGTGFGFPSYPQRPSVDPQTVGSLLQQRQQQPAAPAAQAQPMMAGVDAMAVGRQLSDSGADDTPIGGAGHLPSALSIAAREATARGPAATAGTQRNPAAPGTHEQLRRMGVSEEEIHLLTLGGSIR